MLRIRLQNPCKYPKEKQMHNRGLSVRNLIYFLSLFKKILLLKFRKFENLLQ